jgi:hypothetical protein
LLQKLAFLGLISYQAFKLLVEIRQGGVGEIQLIA